MTEEKHSSKRRISILMDLSSLIGAIMNLNLTQRYYIGSNFLSLGPLKNLFLRYLSNKRVGYLAYKLFL